MMIIELNDQEAMLVMSLLITPDVQARLSLANKLRSEHDRQAHEAAAKETKSCDKV